MSRPVIVSDAGPLIALAGCDQLELLTAVFDAIHVPLDDQMQANGYRISQTLIDEALRLAGEAP